MLSFGERPHRGHLLALFVVGLPLGALAFRHVVWQGTLGLHTVVEAIDTLLAVVTGAMSLVRYYTKKSGIFLLLGSGLVAVGLLDAYHAFFNLHRASAMTTVRL